MKKFFTFIAIACLSVINAVAAITYETDVEYKSLAELDGKTFAIVNKAEGKALYGSNAQNLGYGAYADAFKSTNSGYMWKIVKDADVDAYYLQLVTPAGTDYNCWNMGGVLNSQGEPQGWACSFILGTNNQKGQDIPNGALYELAYTENGWTMKNVGTGMYTQYSTGPANSEEPTYWTFCTIKEVGEEDPIPPVVIPESLKPFIENKTIFTLKNGDNYVYGPDQQNLAIGSWEQASAETNNANGYILEVDEYYFYLRAVKTDGSDISAWGTKPCWLNNNGGNVVFNMGKDQDVKNGSSWTLAEVGEGKYSIESVNQPGKYLAIGANGTSGTLSTDVTEWELYVPAAPEKEKVTIEDMSLTVAEGEQIDEDGDFKVTFNYKGIINDESVMPSGSFKISVYDADNNPIVEGEPWTFTFSAGSKNVYVSDLEGGKEYTIKVDEVVVKDNSKIDYETVFTGEEILKITEGLPSLKFTPIAAEVAPVEVKDMKMTYDKNELIDEEGDYQVTFNYTGKINDETIKPEDLYSVIKYQVYDEDYNLAASGTRDFDITAGSRNVYVSGLTAGKTYQFMVTGLVVMNGETEVLNLTSGLPKLTFKVKDPNAPQAITMSNMSFTVAEGEKIDEDGDFKVTFNYTATINDASAVNYPFATVTYEVTDENGEKVGGTVAQFSIEETSKNLYISNLVEGKSYTITATKIEIQDFVTMEMLCETEKDLPTLTFTAGDAPEPVVHTWDFTNWSAETKANLEAEYQKSVEEQTWSRIEKAADKENPEKAVEGCYWQVAHGTLTANGQEIAELKGLEFTNTNDRGLAIAVNYPSTTLGTYHGAQYLWLGGKNIAYFTIKNVKVGSTIKMGVESHKPAEGRGVTLTNVAENPAAPTVFEEQSWTVTGETEVVDVVVTNTNGCHIYYIDAEIVDVPDGISNVAINNANVIGKFVENGKIVIVKNGKKYSVNGYQMK